MANIGLPGTSSFLGEFLIIAGCVQTNTWVALFSAIGMVLGGGYRVYVITESNSFW
jgi:NADH-quinone oxidoreductase subunit M